MKQIRGIEYCATHGGILTEGTDYAPEGLGCEYAEIGPVVPDDCVPVPLFIDAILADRIRAAIAAEAAIAAAEESTDWAAEEVDAIRALDQLTAEEPTDENL